MACSFGSPETIHAKVKVTSPPKVLQVKLDRFILDLLLTKMRVAPDKLYPFLGGVGYNLDDSRKAVKTCTGCC